MRRADDFDVEPVGIVPPVIEGRRCDHHQRSPNAHPRAERPVEVVPEAQGTGFLLGGAGERRSEDQIATAQAGDDRRRLLEEVGERPESVAAHGAMPRDVPDQTDDDARRRKNDRRERPGDGPRA